MGHRYRFAVFGSDCPNLPEISFASDKHLVHRTPWAELFDWTYSLRSDSWSSYNDREPNTSSMDRHHPWYRRDSPDSRRLAWSMTVWRRPRIIDWNLMIDQDKVADQGNRPLLVDLIVEDNEFIVMGVAIELTSNGVFIPVAMQMHEQLSNAMLEILTDSQYDGNSSRKWLSTFAVGDVRSGALFLRDPQHIATIALTERTGIARLVLPKFSWSKSFPHPLELIERIGGIDE